MAAMDMNTVLRQQHLPKRKQQPQLPKSKAFKGVRQNMNPIHIYIDIYIII
jgi:hypothetical protein